MTKKTSMIPAKRRRQVRVGVVEQHHQDADAAHPVESADEAQTRRTRHEHRRCCPRTRHPGSVRGRHEHPQPGDPPRRRRRSGRDRPPWTTCRDGLERTGGRGHEHRCGALPDRRGQLDRGRTATRRRGTTERSCRPDLADEGRRVAADAVRRRLRRHPLAGRVRRPGADARAPGRVDHRVRPRPGAAVPEHGRMRADRLGAAGVRHTVSSRRSTCGRSSPASGSGASCSASRTRGRTWPALSTTGGARRRRLRGRRPEGVVLQRPCGRLGHPHGPHRHRRCPSQGHLVPARRHGLARGRAPTAAPDERRGRVRRGLPDRGAGAGGQPAGTRSTRAGWSACQR